MLLAVQFQLEPLDVVYVTPYKLTSWNRIVTQILPTIQGLWQTRGHREQRRGPVPGELDNRSEETSALEIVTPAPQSAPAPLPAAEIPRRRVLTTASPRYGSTSTSFSRAAGSSP